MVVRVVRHLCVSVDPRSASAIPCVIFLAVAACAGGDSAFGPSCADRTVVSSELAPTTLASSAPACSGGSAVKRIPTERQ